MFSKESSGYCVASLLLIPTKETLENAVASYIKRGSTAFAYGQWLHVKKITRGSLKPEREYILPSTPCKEKSGASSPIFIL